MGNVAERCQVWLCKYMTDTALPVWTLGDRLRKAREHANIGQAEMARVLGITAASVSRFESDQTAPRRAYLIVWADRCGVPLWWITGDPPSSTTWFSVLWAPIAAA